ncbi:hypothetical protein [Leptospira noguchii]|uniref:hypothetical protein n=1 Tax=Leptospira noguchii TaxID=28182 RepID=UPI000569C069|nr:hypothetical protein [Leptospira noguchii]
MQRIRVSSKFFAGNNVLGFGQVQDKSHTSSEQDQFGNHRFQTGPEQVANRTHLETRIRTFLLSKIQFSSLVESFFQKEKPTKEKNSTVTFLE